MGMVCSYGCVCMCEALVCAGLPLVLLNHCFSSLGQETAVESEVEVKVCTQPFEGYSALFAKINQIARSWAFTELEKPHHVSTFAQTQAPAHCQSCWITHGHRDGGGSRDDIFSHGFLRYFHLNDWKSGTVLRINLCAFSRWKRPERATKISSRWGAKVKNKMNEELSETSTVIGLFWASRFAMTTCHFLGKLVTHPRPTGHITTIHWVASLWLFALDS